MNLPDPHPNSTPPPMQMGTASFGPAAAAFPAPASAGADVALDGDTKTLSIKIANISMADAQFLAGVVALFTDPARPRELALLKADAATIGYGPQGAAVVQMRFSQN